MKTTFPPTRAESDAPNLEPRGERGCRTFALVWLTLSITVSATGCSYEATCAETATCPPSAEPDGGGADSLGDRAETFDQRSVVDGLRPDGETSVPADARSTQDTRADSPIDSPSRDTIDAARADSFTDISVDAKSADVTFVDIASDSPTTDSGVVKVDAPSSDTSSDAVPGIDVSNDVSVDAGGTADVIVGCNSTTCPSGCCDTNDQCVTTPSIDACGGWGGGKCVGCGSGQECNGTSCVCTAHSCTTGCCNGTSCVPFASQSDPQCGAGGACTSCSTTMQSCDKSNGQCVCNAASCPTGCCDSSKHCVPYAGQSDGVCGAGGLACAGCTSDKFCNATGGCDVKNWCRTQTIPAGIANADYQCLDFDTGMPPINVWVPTVQSFGILELVTDQVQSVPNSLHARSSPTDGMTPIPESIGQLVWGASGALVSAVSVTTDIYPLQLQGGAASRSDYLCLKIGALKGCLAYFVPGTLSALSLVFPDTSSGPGGFPVCEIGPTLDAPVAAWTRVTLRLTRAGVLSLTIGTTTLPCNANATASSGVTAVQLGAHGVIEGANFGDARFDNVVTYIER